MFAKPTNRDAITGVMHYTWTDAAHPFSIPAVGGREVEVQGLAAGL